MLWDFSQSYVLFLNNENGMPHSFEKGNNGATQNRWSEHGLRHFLNRTNPESEDRDWIAHVWQES